MGISIDLESQSTRGPLEGQTFHLTLDGLDLAVMRDFGGHAGPHYAILQAIHQYLMRGGAP